MPRLQVAFPLPHGLAQKFDGRRVVPLLVEGDALRGLRFGGRGRLLRAGGGRKD